MGILMSFGKNPKNFSKGRKGHKKKVGDRFLKKEWWDIKAPGMFINRKFTKSPVNVSAGKKLSSDAMKARVYEVNLGDLNGQGALTYKKIKLIVDDSTESSHTCSYQLLRNGYHQGPLMLPHQKMALTY